MNATPNKKNLPPARQRLVELMQRINYGCIEDLTVRRGEPVMHPLPRRTFQFKFRGDNGPRPESVKTNFALKAEVCELFARLEALGDGVVRSIEIQRGLPFRMTIEEVSV